MGAGDLSEPPVRLDVVFDRFPASIRGALVVRGADPDPHQVTVTEAFVADLATPSRAAGEVGIAGSTVHVRPRGEIVIPFEVPFSELAPAWYLVAVTVDVDGQWKVAAADPATRFPVAWPRELVRRGAIEVGAAVDEPGGATIQRVECKPDRAIVRWASRDEAVGDLKVLADGKSLPVLDRAGEAAALATTVYPILRHHRRLRFQIDRPKTPDGARGEGFVEVPLD